MKKSGSILFLVPYPLRNAPSQRFRIELYEPYLKELGVKYHISSFIDQQTWHILYKPGNSLKKAFGIFKGLLRRIKDVLIEAPGYDYIFIHREAAPIGPPVFEWILAKLLGKKIIYDFDDAIWLPNTTNTNGIAAWFKAHWKVKYISKWAHTVVGGNRYLCDYASQYNKNVVCIPTVVDTERMHNQLKEHREDSIIVGWTGSHSTLPFLDPIIPSLKELHDEYPFTLLVIANKKPDYSFPSLMFIPWNEETEIEDLLKIDIGIMPLVDDAWSEGKCGFKLIQYMSLGIPAVASPVGVNKAIIEHGVNGYIGNNGEEWKQYLMAMMKDTQFRKKLGKAGREKIVKEFSITSQKDKFLELFRH